MEKEIRKITLNPEQTDYFLRNYGLWLGIHCIFEYGVEPREEDFRECTRAQYRAIAAQHGSLPTNEKLFGWFFPKRMHMPHEILIANETDKSFLFEAAKVIDTYATKSGRVFQNYKEKLKYVSSIFSESLSKGTPFERKNGLRLAEFDDSPSRDDHGVDQSREESSLFRIRPEGFESPIARRRSSTGKTFAPGCQST